jgi:hypothetical protein
MLMQRMTSLARRTGVAALFIGAASAYACDYPDLGNLPLRRAVSKVKFLPQTEAWAIGQHKAGKVVQYALQLEQTLQRGGRCYWTVDAIAEGKVWRRFYVTPDGKRVLGEDLRPAGAPRAARPSAAAKVAAP